MIPPIKGLSEIDIKFYGKIHFDRNRSDNELNIHCHLIVSRKDQANKKKLSPLTNHKNTKKGAVTGGFDRVNLFQQAEQGFNKLFGYDRQQSESFNYHNTMKNNSIFEQLKQQEVQICEKKTENKENNNQESLLSINPENNITDGQASNITTKHEKHTSSANSLFPFFLPKTSSTDEENLLITKKKRKRALHKR